MNNWFAAAAAGVLALFGASTTNDHRPPSKDFQGQPSTTRPVKASLDVQCISTAVATREMALQEGETTYASGVHSAYSARAIALASAYTQIGNDTVKTAMRAAWKQFTTTMEGVKSAWQKSKDSAWSTFRAAVKSCGVAASAVADTANAGSEMSVQ